MVDENPPEQRDLIHKHELLRAEDIAVAVHYVLTQPARCDVVSLPLHSGPIDLLGSLARSRLFSFPLG